MGLNLRAQPTNPYWLRLKINDSVIDKKLYLILFATMSLLLGLVTGSSSVLGLYTFKHMLKVKGLFFSGLIGLLTMLGMYFVVNVTIIAVFE